MGYLRGFTRANSGRGGRARYGRPHLIAGGSSTEGAGFWEVQVDDHRALEAVAHPLR